MDQTTSSLLFLALLFVVLRLFGDNGMFIELIIHDLPTHDQQCSIFSYHGYFLDRPCQIEVPLV